MGGPEQIKVISGHHSLEISHVPQNSSSKTPIVSSAPVSHTPLPALNPDNTELNIWEEKPDEKQTGSKWIIGWKTPFFIAASYIFGKEVSLLSIYVS